MLLIAMYAINIRLVHKNLYDKSFGSMELELHL